MTTTVLFHHPVPGSGFDPDPSATAAADVRLLAPHRPGYGDAPGYAAGEVPSLGATVDRIADDVRAGGVERLDLVVGWSGGGQYALAMAARHPDLVGAVALVATPAHDDDVRWIPEQFRPLTEAMRADPAHALAMVLEALEGSGPSPDLVAGGPADDALLAERPELAGRLDAMLAGAFAQGPLGMGTDLVAQHVSPWNLDPAAVTQPVTIVHGDADPLLTLDHARHWADVLPNADLRVVEGAGHLVVVPEWPALLRR
jgi:pimeloyl-ACP methyl ester carboxylesterase